MILQANHVNAFIKTDVGTYLDIKEDENMPYIPARNRYLIICLRQLNYLLLK